MAKVMVINGVWATLICGMLAFTVVLYSARIEENSGFSPYMLDNSHVASIDH